MPLFVYNPTIPTPQPHFLAKKKLKKAYFDVFTLVQASLMPSDFGLFWPILGYFSLFWAICPGTPFKHDF